MNQQPTIWCDGELIAADSLQVSPFDLGLTVGWGVFETMVAYEGKVFCLADHLTRLQQTADECGIKVPQRELLEKALPELLQQNDLTCGRARIRLTITGGENPLTGGEQAGKVILTALPLPEPADHALLHVSSIEQPSGAGRKLLSYAHRVAALRDAQTHGADEAVVMNTRGEICECAMANLFLVQGNEIHTPPLESGCLPGVTRAVVFELGKILQLPVTETVLYEEDLATADELFITNSTREVQSASLLGSDVETGEITQRLQCAYRELVVD